MSPGQYTIFWEGNSQKGEDIPSGIYLFRVKVNDYVEQGKITLLKYISPNYSDGSIKRYLNKRGEYYCSFDGEILCMFF